MPGSHLKHAVASFPVPAIPELREFPEEIDLPDVGWPGKVRGQLHGQQGLHTIAVSLLP